MKWAEQQRIETDPFCDGLDYRKGREGCVRGRSAVGPCFATNYTTDLPVEYQVSVWGRVYVGEGVRVKGECECVEGGR